MAPKKHSGCYNRQLKKKREKQKIKNIKNWQELLSRISKEKPVTTTSEEENNEHEAKSQSGANNVQSQSESTSSYILNGTRTNQPDNNNAFVEKQETQTITENFGCVSVTHVQAQLDFNMISAEVDTSVEAVNIDLNDTQEQEDTTTVTAQTIIDSTILKNNDIDKAIDYNNPSTWDLSSDKIRKLLIERGPDFVPELEKGKRYLTKIWFSKTLSNGSIISRKWLLYSKNMESIFCFPCMLFSKAKPCLSNQYKGFCDWGHLNPRIPEHENTKDYRQSYIDWRNFEKRLSLGGLIDDEFENCVRSEKQKWRHIIKVIIDAVMFYASNCLAFRGSNEIVGDPGCGNFLNVIELISKYDTIIQQHIKSHNKNKVTYFSAKIQNEIVSLMAGKVRIIILAAIKRAKYYSISFDCTPDQSHDEQMSQIIRYVDVKPSGCSVKESFFDFIKINSKTGEGIAKEICEKLQKDGLNLNDIRGQSYDNGANMAGIYNVVQAHITRVNKLANFVPCTAHSLNLVGVHAAAVNSTMKTFLSNVQKIYNFFVSSTSRWEILTKHVLITLKGHCDTRWSSKYDSVNALRTQMPKVLLALNEIVNNSSNHETKSNALVLISQMKSYKFILLLVMWNIILKKINTVNIMLQAKEQNISSSANLVNSLKNQIKGFRNTGLDQIFAEALVICAHMSIDAKFPGKRKRKVKIMPGEEAVDEHTTDDIQEFRIEVFEVLDKIITQMDARFQVLEKLSSTFKFLNGSVISETPTSELKNMATNLALEYDQDLNKDELCSEIETLKFHCKASFSDIELSNLSPLQLLNWIHSMSLQESYPNIEIVLRIFLTLPVTSASCERSFSKLKRIKNYLRSTMGQERLTDLGIIAIERDVSSSIDYEEVIEEFASKTARRVPL